MLYLERTGHVFVSAAVDVMMLLLTSPTWAGLPKRYTAKTKKYHI